MVARRAAAKAAQSEADDRLLVEAAQKDPSRFGDLYEVNFARVYAFVARLAPLLQIARQLRDLPRENFKPSLKSDLEGTLSMATARQPIAAVRTFASPRLSYKSAAKAIEFYEKAFGAKESWRFETESGIGHAEIMIGDSTVMLCEEWPEGGRYSAETLGQSPVSMTINVPDVDAFV